MSESESDAEKKLAQEIQDWGGGIVATGEKLGSSGEPKKTPAVKRGPSGLVSDITQTSHANPLIWKK